MIEERRKLVEAVEEAQFQIDKANGEWFDANEALRAYDAENPGEVER